MRTRVFLNPDQFAVAAGLIRPWRSSRQTYDITQLSYGLVRTNSLPSIAKQVHILIHHSLEMGVRRVNECSLSVALLFMAHEAPSHARPVLTNDLLDHRAIQVPA